MCARTCAEKGRSCEPFRGFVKEKLNVFIYLWGRGAEVPSKSSPPGRADLSREVRPRGSAGRPGPVGFDGSGQELMANAGAREFISYVPQGNTLFSGTIRENIRMGKLDATEEEFTEALKMASAYDFVSELPNGIDTVIGERGHGISEGQAQRIAIARALIRKAPFLILDEATASLDPQTELAVLQGIKNMQPKPTCLLITHRMSVLEYCDRQIKIEDKKIASA